MFIVHFMPYTKGSVSCSDDVAKMETFRVSDSCVIGFIDNLIDKKHYISIRPAFHEDENVTRWKLIE